MSVDPAENLTALPLYRQVKSRIVQGLESGEWKPGTMLPGEFELSRRFGVAHGTVRKAIDELALENMLVRRQGKGTFVASHTEPDHLSRFLRLTAYDGITDHPTVILLDFEKRKADKQLAASLNINAGDLTYFIRRMLWLREQPTVYEEIHLADSIFKGLTAAKCEKHKGYIYLLMESEFGVKLVYADEQLSASSAQKEEAKLLKVRVGTPLLQVDRVAYTFGDRPVEFRRGRYLTSTHFYKNRLG